MCSDPAPFTENLFLYYFDNKELLDTKKQHLRKARLFSNEFRFVDDFSIKNLHEL